MKKTFLIVVFALSTLCMSAQELNGGLFQRGQEQTKEVSMLKGGPGLPDHGQNGNQPAPIGSGALMLIGFGAAYAIYKKNKK